MFPHRQCGVQELVSIRLCRSLLIGPLAGERDDGLVGEVVLLQSAHCKQDVVGMVFDWDNWFFLRERAT